MKTIQITEKEAKEFYKSGTPEIKQKLENEFGEDFFKETPYESITTVEKAFKAVNEDYDVFQKKCQLNGDTPDEITYKTLKIITKAINGNWEPDYDNTNQQKWAPWFYMDKPAFRFYDSHYEDSDTYSGLGSRLVFSNKPRADHAAKHFLKIYETFLSNK